MHMQTSNTWILHNVIRSGVLAMLALGGVGLVGCRPSDVLSVPPPVGVIGSTTLANAAGAESELAGATAQLFVGIAGETNLVQLSGLLTDEFGWSWYTGVPQVASIDARITAVTELGATFSEWGDQPLSALLAARSSLLVALSGLRQYEPASGQSKIGKAYALTGYAELLLAEDYCAGVPLIVFVPGGGIQYGTPLTSDSLLGTAEAHFDSALAYGAGNDTVVALASVGLGRTRLDRGHFAAAATAVAAVATGFAYNAVTSTNGSAGGVNFYQFQLPTEAGCGLLNMADREGGNGLNFASAQDPRLVVDSTVEQTCDGGTWYYPAKFGNPSQYIPLATGVEARLIAAEAALQGGDASTWAADLNALRAAAPSTYLQLDSAVRAMKTDPTGVDSLHPTQDQAVDILFRERAFWLYGTGTRQGDLRRLIRQYGRDQNTVFPSGPFANGNNPNLPSPLPSYGTDVSFTLPTAASGNTTSNPNYKGCLVPTSTG
jgi:hypothetical protein